MGIENPIHLIFLAGVALLVLGPKRLPEVARTLGKGLREFREAISGDGSVGGFMHEHLDVGGADSASTPAPIATATSSRGEPASSSAVAPTPVPSVDEGIQAADAVPTPAPVPDAAPPQVDPPEPVRSGDAPNRRPL